MYFENDINDDAQFELLVKNLKSFVNITEKDFYPPKDNRVLKTGLKGNRYDSIESYRKDYFKYIENNS